MIFGIGLDTTTLSRFEDLAENEKFINRILTEREKEDFYALSQNKKANFLAKRFSAKEAFAKALGTGISATFGFHSISIIKTKENAPKIVMNDERLKANFTECFVSFSDEKLGKDKLISSIVILEK